MYGTNSIDSIFVLAGRLVLAGLWLFLTGSELVSGLLVYVGLEPRARATQSGCSSCG